MSEAEGRVLGGRAGYPRAEVPSLGVRQPHGFRRCILEMKRRQRHPELRGPRPAPPGFSRSRPAPGQWGVLSPCQVPRGASSPSSLGEQPHTPGVPKGSGQMEPETGRARQGRC